MKAIAAMAQNRVIGNEGKIPWHIPDDFKWFKQTTMGRAVLMGRKTFASLGKPLPGRINLVATRQTAIPGVVCVPDLDAFDPGAYADVFVIGGAEIYEQTLRRCSDLFLSVIHREVEGDAWFPEFESFFELAGTVLRHPEFEVRHYRNPGTQEPYRRRLRVDSARGSNCVMSATSGMRPPSPFSL